MRRMPADDVDSFVKAFHVAEHLLEPYDEEHWRNVRYVVARHFALNASNCNLRVTEGDSGLASEVHAIVGRSSSG